MQTVNVLYKYVDGAHFFVSYDDKTLGLCVAHSDLTTAFEAVGPTLEKLFKENHGEDVKFQPEMSLCAFQKWFEHRSREALTTPVPGTAGFVPWAGAEVA